MQFSQPQLWLRLRKNILQSYSTQNYNCFEKVAMSILRHVQRIARHSTFLNHLYLVCCTYAIVVCIHRYPMGFAGTLSPRQPPIRNKSRVDQLRLRPTLVEGISYQNWGCLAWASWSHLARTQAEWRSARAKFI